MTEDPEVILVKKLNEGLQREGFYPHPVLIANIYVSLKTKPLLILVGPEGTGKLACSRLLMKTLSDGGLYRSKELVGHPWWATAGDSAPFFVEAQTRINTDVIFGMIEDASKSENRTKSYIICLAKISGGELATFFSDFAVQLNYGRFIALPTRHLSEPVLFPPNLSIIATMDTRRLDWADTVLLSQAHVINWQGSQGLKPRATRLDYQPSGSPLEQVFLNSRIRDRQVAFYTYQQVTSRLQRAFEPVLQVVDRLKRHRVAVPMQVVVDIVTYLSNAWSRNGNGLFHEAPVQNLQTAMDYAIVQTLLPVAFEHIRPSNRLTNALLEILDTRFPNAHQFVNSLPVV